ncbi:MAG TPA: CapA family protein [Thermomicrobiales bacterium]|nr:CapA family protein [Thermomicrobiales bacterium]
MGSGDDPGGSWLREAATRVSTLLISSSAKQTRRGAPRRAIPELQGDDTFEIVWVGDILLADAAVPSLTMHGYTWPFAHLRSLMIGDFLIGIAEGPLTDRIERNPLQRWSYNADPRAATALREVGFDALSLANNHVFDRGPEGVRDTIRHLEAAGIRYFGAGMDDAQAAAPLLIETPHGVVAVLGFGDRRKYYSIASGTDPGITYFDAPSIARGKEIAIAGGARWTIAFVHWGKNYAPVTNSQRRVAAAFAAAGYDLVIGAHPHVQQPVDVIDGMPVLYSLGNFVFGTPGRFSTDAPGYGLVVRTAIGANGVERIAVSCILTDNAVVAFQPRPCVPEEAQRVVAGLGPRVIWDGTTGVVR